jgi:hypothetical protein
MLLAESVLAAGLHKLQILKKAKQEFSDSHCSGQPTTEVTLALLIKLMNPFEMTSGL